MLILITGGSGSGKSEYAEELVLRLIRQSNNSLLPYYIATMKPFGEETLKKIERHRLLRKDKGFETIECYTDLQSNLQDINQSNSLKNKRAVVLLECMSNLLANEMYESDGAGDNAFEHIIRGVNRLYGMCEHLIIVSNEIAADIYKDDMKEYVSTLSLINKELTKTADFAIEAVYSIPVFYKGEADKLCF